MFVSTLGEEAPNVKITGVTNYSQMHRLVQHSWIYLNLVRETMGIGTLEALASGVPCVGWDFGGQSEIIRQGETGILVPYGDYGMLASAVQTVWNARDSYSRAARADALARWQWPDKIEQYARLYTQVYDEHRSLKTKPRVSIVVTCYNLATFLPDALGSLIEQTFRKWDCIIIDDCSTDETEAVARAWEQRGKFKYIKTPKNLGLSGARNLGASHATGEYLIFLDADDMLDRSALQELVDGLDADRRLHVAFGALDVISEEGGERVRNRWPVGDFDWRAQIAHLNQLPYASLMRRSMFNSVGGYRTRDWRAEDASFWIRASSFGFRVGRVTERPILVYRNRAGSKSGQERNSFPDADGDWTSWFPWRLAGDSKAGEVVMRQHLSPDHHLVPFGAQGEPPAPHQAWPVKHHAEPLISVIIPVGPGHAEFLVDALDSLVAQTFPEWEVIVVDDTGDELDLRAHPFARVVKTSVPGSGAGKARNIGIVAARAPLLFFLDADDWIRPDALYKMVETYAREGGYIYSDCVALVDDVSSRLYTQQAGANWAQLVDLYGHDVDEPKDGVWRIEAADYNRKEFLGSGYTDDSSGAHSVSILVAKVDIEEIGGFDEGLAFWEDWEEMLRLAKEGICGHHVNEPLLSYRFKTGRRRRAAREVREQLQRILSSRYAKLAEETDMGCNCGGGGPTLQQRAAAALSPYQAKQVTDQGIFDMPGADTVPGFKESAKINLRYVGRKSAPVPYVGKVTGTVYRACQDSLHDVIAVDPQDVEGLIRTREFQVLGQAVEEVGTIRW
jgi:glycosyltransferase involved in cell wall biosynthesis